MPEYEFWMIVRVQESRPIEGLEEHTTGWLLILADGTEVFLPQKYGVVPVAGDMAKILRSQEEFTPLELSIEGQEVWSLGEQELRAMVEQREADIARVYSVAFSGHRVPSVTIEGVDEEKRLFAEQRIQQRLNHWRAVGRNQFVAAADQLPEPLRGRLHGFLERGGDPWGIVIGPQELFVCQEAAKMISHGRERFHELMQHEAKGSVTFGFLAKEFDLDIRSHSLETLACSRVLAHGVFCAPESVFKIHGVLCPIIGCDEAACWATTPEARAEEALETQMMLEIESDLRLFNMSEKHLVVAKNRAQAEDMYAKWAGGEPNPRVHEEPMDGELEMESGATTKASYLVMLALRQGYKVPFVLGENMV